MLGYKLYIILIYNNSASRCAYFVNLTRRGFEVSNVQRSKSRYLAIVLLGFWHIITRLTSLIISHSQILCGCSILGSCHWLQCLDCGYRICGNDDGEVNSRHTVDKMQVVVACNRCVMPGVLCATSHNVCVDSVEMMIVVVLTRDSLSGFQAVKTCGTLCLYYCKYFSLKRQYSIENYRKPIGILFTNNN